MLHLPSTAELHARRLTRACCARLSRSEARATRLKCSPTAVKIRFARYLVDELRAKSILQQAEYTSDCSCCLGTFRPELPGTTVWSIATPCGHWRCGECHDRLEEKAREEGRPLICLECKEVIRTVRERAWPGQCVSEPPEQPGDATGPACGIGAPSLRTCGSGSEQLARAAAVLHSSSVVADRVQVD